VLRRASPWYQARLLQTKCSGKGAAFSTGKQGTKQSGVNYDRLRTSFGVVSGFVIGSFANDPWRPRLVDSLVRIDDSRVSLGLVAGGYAVLAHSLATTALPLRRVGLLLVACWQHVLWDWSLRDILPLHSLRSTKRGLGNCSLLRLERLVTVALASSVLRLLVTVVLAVSCPLDVLFLEGTCYGVSDICWTQATQARRMLMGRPTGRGRGFTGTGRSTAGNGSMARNMARGADLGW
jgi:hypothetical protein